MTSVGRKNSRITVKHMLEATLWAAHRIFGISFPFWSCCLPPPVLLPPVGYYCGLLRRSPVQIYIGSSVS